MNRRDLIEAFKIVTGKETLWWERLFKLAPNNSTRGHGCQLFKKPNGTLGQKFFSARVMDMSTVWDDRNRNQTFI